MTRMSELRLSNIQEGCILYKGHARYLAVFRRPVLEISVWTVESVDRVRGSVVVRIKGYLTEGDKKMYLPRTGVGYHIPGQIASVSGSDFQSWFLTEEEAFRSWTEEDDD